MAIVIQTQKTEIPIELGELKFAFDVSDESVKQFRENTVKLREELESLSVNEQDDEVLELAKDVLRRGFTIMLGEGSFEKIYELSPSVTIVMSYFVQISEGIAKELNNMGYSESQAEKAKKYIAKKNK